MLNLVVIKAVDLERAVALYTALGCRFKIEKHGSGPEHCSAEFGGLVFEIYPRQADEPETAATRLGFTTDDIEAAIERATALGALLVKPHEVTSRGYRAVIRDLEGHKIEISQGL